MVIFLTGAPDARALEWKDEDLTTPSSYTGIFRKDPCITPDISLYSVWRSLPVERQYLPTGISQVSLRPDQLSWSPRDRGDHNETSFLSVTDLSYASTGRSEDNRPRGNEDAEETLSQYYEHSYAIHEDLPNSQIVYSRSSHPSSLLSESSDDFKASVPICSMANEREEHKRIRPLARDLMNLRLIPNASYLRSIAPQTMTVDLIVGVIALSEPRAITSRKTGRMLELVEMTVGDDTSAGFGVNIWLPMASANARETDDQNLRSSIAKLRPQDVVLLRNVALSSFRGKVYGQSLRRDMTKLDLLYRNTIDAKDEKGIYDVRELEDPYPNSLQVEKVRKVRDWVMAFVGVRMIEPSRVDCAREASHARTKPLLPPDTQ